MDCSEENEETIKVKSITFIDDMDLIYKLHE